jgi:hypothetical protein
MKTTLLAVLATILLLSAGFSDPGEPVNPFRTYADSIFRSSQDSPKLSYQRILRTNNTSGKVAVLIGNIFQMESRHAIVLYSLNDTAVAIEMREHKKGSWSTKQIINVNHAKDLATEQFIFLSNLNNDEFGDVILLYSRNKEKKQERFNGLIFRKGQLQLVKGIEKYPNLSYDPASANLYGQEEAGCEGQHAIYHEGRIEKGNLKTLRTIDCNCCNAGKDSCTISINQRKPFVVPKKRIYRFIPNYYFDQAKKRFEK